MSLKKIDVLIVDDIPANLMSIEAALVDEEINLIKAYSGEEALSKMLDYDFALVLLDVQMPEMNGFEVADFMKKSEKTKYIPIIFVTAINKEDKYITLGYKSGAVDYLFKPINPTILVSKVRIFLDLHRQKQIADDSVKRLEKKIDELRESKEANSLKDQFLANISHELRTPLNAIIGISKMIEKYEFENLNDHQKEGIKTIHISGERLLALINDILDTSKIEAGKMELFNEPFSLVNMINGYDMIVKNIVNEKKISFKVDIDRNVPDIVLGDEKKLNQVIMNLLGNAVKFTEQGEVFLSVKMENDKVLFSVQDTGVGIAKDDLDGIFQKFKQIDGKLSRKHVGTGLGLALSKAIVEMMGGEIGVVSTPNLGTTFYFKIALDRAQILSNKMEIGEIIEKRQKIKKILVVDDEEIGRITAKFYLGREYDLTLADSGEQGVYLVANEKFDLILLDIMMPHMDGFETLKKIREIDKKVNVVALTGLAKNEEKNQILDSKFDYYLSKPIVESELKYVLENFI